MKLLVFSDLHTNETAAQRIVERSQRADIVIGAGDFAHVRRHLDKSIAILRAITRPTILVAGNAETTDELLLACRGWSAATVLHGSATTVEGQSFFGLGGAVPVTPFGDWSYDFSEEQASVLLKSCPPGCVLISHSPPKGVVDVNARGEHLGSVTVRDTILRVRPKLVICGHIHDSAGQSAFLEDVPVINPGPAGVEWELAV